MVKKKKQERKHYLTDSEELASGMIYHKNRGGKIKEKSLFPLHKRPLSPNHTHTHKMTEHLWKLSQARLWRGHIYLNHTPFRVEKKKTINLHSLVIFNLSRFPFWLYSYQEVFWLHLSSEQCFVLLLLSLRFSLPIPNKLQIQFLPSFSHGDLSFPFPGENWIQTGRPRGMGWGGRREGGSGWGTHVNPWLIHVNVW